MPTSEDKSKPPTVGKTRPKTRSKAQSFSIHYSNSLEMEISPWDFKLYFGQIEEASDERLSIVESVGVYMSPQHAKAVANVLATNIKSYEATFGQIPMPPSARDSDNERKEK